MKQAGTGPAIACLFCIIIAVIGLACSGSPIAPEIEPFVWPVSTADTQQMNRALLDSAEHYANETGFVDALLVFRNGYLVSEAYFNGYDRDRPHNIKSVSKSFLSAITGIAFEQGYLKSLDQRVMGWFIEYVYPDMDSRKFDITLQHLLTMRMGIVRESDDSYAPYQQVYQSDNWIRSTIEMPLLDDPGKRMRYNTFQTHLLATLISRATGKSILDYATEVLFSRMGIDVDDWYTDPQNNYFGGNSMFFTPREMAVLGYIYLNNGRLDGRQIIPATWVELTLSASTDFTHPNEWGAYRNYNYGWLWWLGQIGEYELFMGYGYGGQFVIVFPEIDLIVVSTAETRVDSQTSTRQEWAIFEIVEKYILPAVHAEP